MLTPVDDDYTQTASNALFRVSLCAQYKARGCANVVPCSSWSRGVGEQKNVLRALSKAMFTVWTCNGRSLAEPLTPRLHRFLTQAEVRAAVELVIPALINTFLHEFVCTKLLLVGRLALVVCLRLYPAQQSGRHPPSLWKLQSHSLH